MTESRRRYLWLLAFTVAALLVSVIGYSRYSGRGKNWYAISFALGAILAALVTVRARRRFVSVLAVLVSLPVIGLIALGYIDYKGGGTEWYHFSFRTIGIILIMAGGFTLFFYLFYIWKLRKKESEFQHLWGEIKFVAFQTHYLWILALSIGCLLAGIRLLIPVDPLHLHERYESIIGTYITVFVAVLGVKFLYRETAPIVEVDHLLRSLINDLNRHIDADKLWVVYPALNIGYYRHHYKLGSVSDDDICEEYKRAQKRCAGRLKDKAQAVTYHKDLYPALYTCYDKMVSGEENPNRIRDCVDDALDFVDDFTEQKPTKRGKLHQMSPDQFPPHVIVIGKIVYFIMSYGLPIYDSKSRTFRPIGHGKGEEKLADLLVYRRHDPETADVISEHLAELVNERTSPTQTSPAKPQPTPASLIPPQETGQAGPQPGQPGLAEGNQTQ